MPLGHSDASPGPGSIPRLKGLTPALIGLLDAAGRALDRRDLKGAQSPLSEAVRLSPEHPEVLRLCAVACVIGGQPADAVAALRHALRQCPDDALLYNNLGSALNATGQGDAAVTAFRRATEFGPNLAAAWYNLGKTLKVRADTAGADEALARAVALAPEHIAARIVYADNLKAIGRVGAAEAAYREALHRDPGAAHAWWGLANLKTVRFDAAETAELGRRFADRAARDRAALGFALAKALEDQDRHADAFGVLTEANALRRAEVPWNAAQLSGQIDAIASAFAAMPRDAGDRGREVVFVVSLPRSGSTLVEQILAAHPEVEGAGELPDLVGVIGEESARRGAAFTEWAAGATDEDWRRLGERYLERTEPWRRARPRFTDKSLLNWPYVGAAARMLPGARFIDCRRDPLETALSCYRQWFNQGQGWSYGIEDIAACLADHGRLMRHWHALLPDSILTLTHEHLLADPEGTVHGLLDFCGLEFDPRCLDFHAAERSVRTASAAQVRRPLARSTGRADLYGPSLDPLRRALASR